MIQVQTNDVMRTHDTNQLEGEEGNLSTTIHSVLVGDLDSLPVNYMNSIRLLFDRQLI